MGRGVMGSGYGGCTQAIIPTFKFVLSQVWIRQISFYLAVAPLRTEMDVGCELLLGLGL
jgi:hypothetical protein